MQNKSLPWFGIILIVFGAALLLVKTDLINVDFDQVVFSGLMLLGLGLVVKGFSRDRRGQVFGGTVLFLYSLYFLLKTFDFVYYHSYMFIPASFLIIGIGFFMMFISNVREFLVLIPAMFFGGLGTAYLFAEMGYVNDEDVWRTMLHYWPVVLILIGLGIIFKRRNQHQPPPPPTQAIPS